MFLQMFLCVSAPVGFPTVVWNHMDSNKIILLDDKKILKYNPNMLRAIADYCGLTQNLSLALTISGQYQSSFFSINNKETIGFPNFM